MRCKIASAGIAVLATWSNWAGYLVVRRTFSYGIGERRMRRLHDNFIGKRLT